MTEVKERMKEITKNLAIKIRNLRLERGFSQEELGASLGVTFQQIQKYETAVNRVSLGTLAIIAEVLSVPITHFFDINDTPEPMDCDINMLNLIRNAKVLQRKRPGTFKCVCDFVRGLAEA